MADIHVAAYLHLTLASVCGVPLSLFLSSTADTVPGGLQVILPQQTQRSSSPMATVTGPLRTQSCLPSRTSHVNYSRFHIYSKCPPLKALVFTIIAVYMCVLVYLMCSYMKHAIFYISNLCVCSLIHTLPNYGNYFGIYMEFGLERQYNH